MKKADKILVLILLLIALAFALFFFLRAEEGGFARVTVDGEVKAELPLSKDILYRVETETGYNVIQIQDGYASIQEADCRDQICVEHKKIHLTGETIVCLPHKLVVEIVGAETTQYDTVVG
ncbi:NusG domain II-containing protein [Anaerotignum sp.]|uniref:NusG domain II-containing protein n=1 Tax=Anaerotignum sp. TaxID=2039241 RepID=UPI0027150229|nr:NusG domain II-containing protein [Anaerotignum sp.]